MLCSSLSWWHARREADLPLVKPNAAYNNIQFGKQKQSKFRYSGLSIVRPSPIPVLNRKIIFLDV